MINLEVLTSDAYDFRYGVPQGAVLGLILFTIYLRELDNMKKQHNISFHMYADDNQLYLAFRPSGIARATLSTETCVAEIMTWMTSNQLK